MTPSSDATGVHERDRGSARGGRYDTVRYGAIDVHYRFDLDGGGRTFGQQFVDAVRSRMGRARHVFEFCAGPGFIGFSLLAHGLCDRLTLADVNPAAVRACEETIRANGLQNHVRVYLADVLDGISAEERWDLVVANPPHFAGTEAEITHERRLVDPGFMLHRRFYRDVRRHLEPGGSVLFQENGYATTADHFVPMIEDAGMQVVDVFPRQRPTAFARCMRAVAPMVERALVHPAVERALRRSGLASAFERLPILPPVPYYFMWSRLRAEPSVDAHAAPQMRFNELRSVERTSR